MDGKTPSTQEISVIQNIIKEVNWILAEHAPIEMIAEQVSLLMAGMKINSNVNIEDTAKAYIIALEGLSKYSIMKATKDYLRGDAPSKVFMPSAPELSCYCRDIEKRLNLKLDMLAKIIEGYYV